MPQLSKNLAATRIALFYRRMRIRKDLQLRCLARETIQRLSRKQTSNRFGIINSRERERISLRQLDAALQLQRWVRHILNLRREMSRHTKEKVWKTAGNLLPDDEMSCRLDEVERRVHEGENREARYQIIKKTRTLEVETMNTRIACIEKQILNLEHLLKSTSDDLEKRLSVMEEVISKFYWYFTQQPQQLAQSNERFVSLDKKVLFLESRLDKFLLNATQPIAPSNTTQTYLPRLPVKPSRLKLPETRKSSLRS
uniref:AlNc14C33G3006 protein n=1 Tax=Albugo laibachii Nc14 TaxID=890382 RepID=F0W8B2_9STRA|nr:AlNc14C33G3006 [Albugo laibachii Nc14]|eukprot:CCA17312.1 AlNc14C33G3006 [Albugo laibachii Nc14]